MIDLDAASLDRWREVADAPADRAVAGYFAELDDGDPRALFGVLARHLQLPSEDQVPAIAEFLTEQAQLPAWADPARLARGQAFFGRLALHHFTVLYLASLPSAYAAADGVHVLWLTARLQDDAERRLNETAQFLMDVTAPGGFTPGHPASQRVLHVRLMHAAVRWLIDHDLAVERLAEADPAVLPPGPRWADSWGRPLNQQDLLGTLLTFTTVVFTAFERSGVETTAAEREDYLHLWCVIGRLLGIEEAILPGDVAEATRLQASIFPRLQSPSAVGAELTATLLGLAARRLPRPVASVAPAMVRRDIGDDVADMIAVAPAGAARRVVGVLVAVTRLLTRRRRADPFPAWLHARFGRALLDGLLREGRHGARVPFAIPDHLAELR